jgi:hypothetical protein
MSIPPDRDVELLLQKYQLLISHVKGAVSLPLNAGYDDLWVLRFLLSAKGDVGKAEAAVLATLKWREEKAVYMQVSGHSLARREGGGGKPPLSLSCSTGCAWLRLMACVKPPKVMGGGQ